MLLVILIVVNHFIDLQEIPLRWYERIAPTTRKAVIRALAINKRVAYGRYRQKVINLTPQKLLPSPEIGKFRAVVTLYVSPIRHTIT